MTSKLALGLATVLALTVLVASAVAQIPHYFRENASRLGTGARPADGGAAQSDSANHDPFDRVQELQDLPKLPADPGQAPTEPSTTPLPLIEFANPNGHTEALWMRSKDETMLTQSAARLAKALGEAKSDTEREKLKDQLSKVLESQFDQRQKRHANEIAALEARVKKLKDLLARRQENRREIVSKRLDQILSEAQGLGW
jgi:hypothetical protein